MLGFHELVDGLNFVDQGLRVISAECCGCLGSSCGFGFVIDIRDLLFWLQEHRPSPPPEAVFGSIQELPEDEDCEVVRIAEPPRKKPRPPLVVNGRIAIIGQW